MEKQNTTEQQRFVSLSDAAHSLGVPTSWLRSEALGGRIPSLRAGRRILINVETVERELLARTQTSEAAQ